MLPTQPGGQIIRPHQGAHSRWRPEKASQDTSKTYLLARQSHEVIPRQLCITTSANHNLLHLLLTHSEPLKPLDHCLRYAATSSLLCCCKTCLDSSGQATSHRLDTLKQRHKMMQAALPSSALSSRAARRFCARNAERLRARVLNVPQRPVRGLAKCSAQAIVSDCLWPSTLQRMQQSMKPLISLITLLPAYGNAYLQMAWDVSLHHTPAPQPCICQAAIQTASCLACSHCYRS